MADRDSKIIAASVSDPLRFAEIFDRHFEAIRRYVDRRLGPRGDEVVSEVFRVAFEQRNSFRADAESARPWLYGIAANLVRRRHRSTARGIAALERFTASPQVSIDPLLGVADRVDAENDVRSLRDSLLSLRDEERDVLLLVAWEQLTPSEAAVVLGIGSGTARTRLHRARQHIRQHVEACQPIPEVPTDAT